MIGEELFRPDDEIWSELGLFHKLKQPKTLAAIKDNSAPFKHLHARLEDWLQQQPDELQLNPQFVDRKTRESFEGLEFYLHHGNIVQEELIRVNVATANAVSLAEGLLMRLDQNEEITHYESAVAVLNDTISVLLDADMVKGFSKGMATELMPFIEATLRDKSPQASYDLRREIETWVLKLPLEDPAILPASLQLFQESRKAQTAAVNHYQSNLMDLQIKVNDLAQNYEGLHNADQIVAIDSLESLVKNRLSEIELFRNGIESRLPKQDSQINIILADLNLVTFPKVNDLSENYRNLASKHHPAILKTREVRNRLWQMIDVAPNPAYRENIPGVKINENGIKSWKRTIDKLFDEKDANWNKMRDLSRINPVFSNAASLYFYNRVKAEIEPKLGWENTLITRDKTGDKGLRMVGTGTLNWISSAKRVDEPGIGLFGETKSDPLSVSKAEPLCHPLYELARELYKGERGELNPSLIEDVKAREAFSQRVDRTIDVLLSTPEKYSDEAMIQLENIKSFSRKIVAHPDFMRVAHDKIVDAETTIRFESVRDNASPSMAALFYYKFNEMLDEKKTKIDSCDNLIRKSQLNNEYKSLKNLFAEHGPKLLDEKGIGQFTADDLTMVETLENDYRQRAADALAHAKKSRQK